MRAVKSEVPFLARAASPGVVAPSNQFVNWSMPRPLTTAAVGAEDGASAGDGEQRDAARLAFPFRASACASLALLTPQADPGPRYRCGVGALKSSL